MPKVSFRMASAYREWLFGVPTNTARKIHRSDHTEGRLTTAPSGCCVRKGTVTGTRRASSTAAELHTGGTLPGGTYEHRSLGPRVDELPPLPDEVIYRIAAILHQHNEEEPGSQS